MEKPSTSKSEHQEHGKSRKKSSDVTGEIAQEKNAEVIPLHKRRFDAKHKELPRGLITLPQANLTIKKPDDPRRFCEDLAERLRLEGPALPELRPLSERSASTATAIVATEEAFDHLDKLYKLMDQLLTLKDQNSKLQRRVRDLEYLKNLQDMHKQIEKEIQRAKTTDISILFGNEATCMDLEEEYGYTEALLDSMLAAGRNASLKRAKWKSPSRSKIRQSLVGKQRSRSMGGEELEGCSYGDAEYCSHLEVPYRGRGRRASDMKGGDEKSKISKWTRVKAAFKWEKAHTGVAPEALHPHVTSAHQSLSAPSPISPSQSVTPLSPTPGSISSASSVEELTDQLTDQQNDRSTDRHCARHESARRSRSLDSSVILDPFAGHLPNDEEVSSPSSSKMHKTPWGKMKDIIQTRKESVKNKQNRNSVKSNSDGKTSENHSLSDGGCISHSESTEIIQDLTTKPPKRKTSSQEKMEAILRQESLEMLKRTTPTLTVTMPSSEELTKANKIVETKVKANQDLSKCTSQSHVGTRTQHLALRKQKSLDMVKKAYPKQQAVLVQDSSDADTGSPVVQRRDSKWKKVKKAFLTSASMSTPSSPSRHSAFFPDYDGEELSSGDFSQAGAPAYSGGRFVLSGISENTSRRHADGTKATIEEEIRRDYEALQNRLSREFSDRALGWSNNSQASPTRGDGRSHEWDKGRTQGGLRQTSLASGPPTPGATPSSASLQTQERLEADFRRRLQDNQRPRGSATPVLSHAQLSEDFRKKLEEWKRLKATNSVPHYTGDEADRPPRDHERDEKHTKFKKVATPKKEVLVQTGAGFFRFEGISRSFTRKLHEWEKSRGIAPEASTSALLRESLARPPLPGLRTTGFGPGSSGLDRPDRGALGMGLCRLQRSQSVGSVREEGAPPPDQLAPAQASSLSLNRLDECKDDQVSDGDHSGPRGGTESDSDGGPAALLVEVEDEEEETAAPLVACIPRPAPQTPVYRYGQAQERHRACENNDGKLSPIAHAVPVPPHPGTEQIVVLVGAASTLLEEEEALQKLVQGHRNIAERCEDVTRQIHELKTSPNRSVARLCELERRVSRLAKEKGIIQNSVRERANFFHNSVIEMRRNIDIFKARCEESSDALLGIAVDLIEKFDQFSWQSNSRVNNISTGKTDCDNFSNDLRNIQRSIESLQSECEKCNIKRRDSNICVSYKVKKPKIKESAEKNKNEIVEKTVTPEESLPSEHRPSIISSTSCDPSIHGPNENITKEKPEKIFVVENKIKSDEESDGTSKGAKKKTKEIVEKGATNSAKRKAKARQRLEKEKSLQSESDSGEEVSTVTIEFPRRRKLVRTRRTSDTHVAYPRQNSFDKQSNTDSGENNIFVLKLKSNPQTEHSGNEKETPILDSDSKRIGKKRSLDSSLSKSNKSLDKEESVQILISPEQFSIEIPVDGIEVQTTNTVPDIFVKTTRKIFSPVTRDSKGKPKAVIGFDLEEIAHSIEKRRADMTNCGDDQNEENLPDIIFNSDVKKADIEAADQFSSKTSVSDLPTVLESQGFNRFDENRRQFSITNSESLSSIRSHTPSPLFSRKFPTQNSSSKTLLGSRNASEESIYQSKDVFPIRRGSGERFTAGCKGSPILSRSSTSGNSASCSLPPLPASPPSVRRDKTKDTSPSIRIMIQKYNKRLNEEVGDAKPPTQGGSNTPPWRSPRSQERFPHDVQRVLHHSTVRNNPFFSREVQKSASASQIMKKPTHSDSEQKPARVGSQGLSKENISDSSEMTPPMPKKLLRGILKSSSAGSLKTTSPICQRKDFSNPMNKIQKISASEEQNRIQDNVKNDTIPTTVNQSNTNENDNRQREDGLLNKATKNDKNREVDINNTKDERQREEQAHLNHKKELYYRRKIDTELLKKAMSTPCAPMQLMDVEKVSINRSGSRAMRLKKAREQFLASDTKEGEDNPIRRDRSTSSNVDLLENRLSQISCGSETSYEENAMAGDQNTRDQDGGLLMKSASVGMINMEREAFDKFNREKGYESLPRNQSIIDTKDHASKTSKFGLSNIASKFRKVRMRKGKQSKNAEKNEEMERLNTITRLCRQSLLVNLHNNPNPGPSPANIQASGDNSGSQTNMSIVSAGRTGGAVAVGNAGFFTAVDKGVCRSASMPDGTSSSQNAPP